jgi:hypothetical protein
MQGTQSDVARCAITRGRIRNALLPRGPVRVWGGRGTGQPCALCDKPIEPTQVEYELEVRTRGSVQSYRFHVECCQSLLQTECIDD